MFPPSTPRARSESFWNSYALEAGGTLGAGASAGEYEFTGFWSGASSQSISDFDLTVGPLVGGGGGAEAGVFFGTAEQFKSAIEVNFASPFLDITIYAGDGALRGISYSRELSLEAGIGVKMPKGPIRSAADGLDKKKALDAAKGTGATVTLPDE